MPKSRVVAAARAWVEELRRTRPEFVRAGYFGSYARGDYVPGSDFDVLVEVAHSEISNWRDRRSAYYPSGFPVGMELFVYTTDELARLRDQNDAFLTSVESEIVWLE